MGLCYHNYILHKKCVLALVHMCWNTILCLNIFGIKNCNCAQGFCMCWQSQAKGFCYPRQKPWPHPLAAATDSAL